MIIHKILEWRWKEDSGLYKWMNAMSVRDAFLHMPGQCKNRM